MSIFIRKTAYTGPLQAAVLDWAGTAVDYGCMGPAAVFVDVFHQFGIDVTVAEARSFMGLEKKEHIRQMCQLPSVSEQWQQTRGKAPTEADVDTLYAETEPMMVDTIRRHCDPIAGVLEFVVELRRQGMRIGSTTGYTRPMVEVLVPEARKKGYAPDSVVCASDVPAGRPFPWMCFQNAINLEVYPLEAIVKIGDTISDIEEGLNAGMWSIGVTRSGNELGLPHEKTQQLVPSDLKRRIDAIETRFKDAGAHYVTAGVWECLPIIEKINARLKRGERP